MLIADELMKAQNSNQEITTLLEEQLEPLIQQVVACFEMAGLAIGIVRGDEVVYAKGFGVKHLETREPVTATSLFHLASVSKPFVATAIMQLAEQGKLDLDTPIVRYLPYFTMNDERYRAITVQQMLSHVSGMPDEEITIGISRNMMQGHSSAMCVVWEMLRCSLRRGSASPTAISPMKCWGISLRKCRDNLLKSI